MDVPSGDVNIAIEHSIEIVEPIKHGGSFHGFL